MCLNQPYYNTCWCVQAAPRLSVLFRFALDTQCVPSGASCLFAATALPGLPPVFSPRSVQHENADVHWIQFLRLAVGEQE